MEARAANTVEVIQEGSRWRHGPPTPETLGEWFSQQPLHDGMDFARYVGGVVLIPSKDTVKRTRERADGVRYISDEEEVVYTPYVRVDTRIAYFRDWVAMHEGWVATITPVPQAEIAVPGSPYFNAHIAKRGFFIHAIRSGDQTTFYICCTMEVAVYERESYARRVKGEIATPIMQGLGTKQVPMTKGYNNRAWADDNCIMKAETGAVGRALGFMGMLVVGTGVATAEDVQEATGEPGTTSGEVQALPPVVDREGLPIPAPESQPVEAAIREEQSPEQADEELRVRALAMKERMAEAFPEANVVFMDWWRGRGFGAISELSGPALRGAVTKLERDLDAAEQAAQSDSSPEEAASQ